MPSLRVVLAAAEEDNLRYQVKQLLWEARHTVIAETFEGESALQVVRSLKPDLVICTVNLPGMDGIELAAQIHFERISPVLLLAPGVTPELLDRAAKAKVYSLLSTATLEQTLIPAAVLAAGRHKEVSELYHEVTHLKETLETRKAVERAKGILMETMGLSELAAHKFIQQESMQKRTSIRNVAEGIILAYEMKRLTKHRK